MNSTQMAMNFLQLLDSPTCEDIEEFIKAANASDYESQNMTRQEYIDSLSSPDCQHKPYPSVQGVKKWVVTGILLSFLIFGLIGNLLSATIMFRRSRRGLSSYFYLAFLAIVDICILYTGCLLFLFEITFNSHPQLHSRFLCRLSFFIQHLFTYMSAWLIVAVTFERFMVVRFPFQSIRICRLRVAYTISSILLLFFSVYTAHCFVTVDLLLTHRQSDEGYHPNVLVCDLVRHRHLLAFIDLCFYSVLPSLLILIFNILIIITMFRAMKQRQEYLQASSYVPTSADRSPRDRKNKTSSTNRTQFFRSRSAESSPAGRSGSQSQKQRVCKQASLEPTSKSSATQSNHPSDSTSATSIRLTCLLLSISFIYVICTLPISIRLLIADFLPTQKSTARWQITQLALNLLMYFNHTINFALYCLTGRAFRSECCKLLRSIWQLKNVRISCTTHSDSDKYQHYHQHFALMETNRFIQSPAPRKSLPVRQARYV